MSDTSQDPTSAETPGGTSADPPAWSRSSSEVAKLLGSDEEAGLSPEAVAWALETHGPNRLTEAPGEPLWKKFAAQLTELVTLILIVAAIVSGFTEHWLDAGVILAIVALNAILGVVQEARAERALEALLGMTAPQARVIRGGEPRRVEAAELVPGDLVELEAGDQIPADLRLTHTVRAKAEEAALTGESVPEDKVAEGVLATDTVLGDRTNMAYMGTSLVAGRAGGLVVATGMSTELGRIATLIQSTEREPTPLQKRLAQLGRTLVMVCLALVFVIFVVQVAQGRELLEVFLVAVSLAVAAVPEGLPAIVTMALALGLQRMVKRNAIVRKLPSVETLGSVTVIGSDKTGTLTRNEMSVRVVRTADNEVRVTGAGYGPEGRLEVDGEAVDVAADPALERLLRAARDCNSAELVETERGPDVLGDPTEGAMLVLARKGGLGAKRASSLAELPFDSDRKRMSVLVADEGAETATLLTKGAPEILLPLCRYELRGGEAVELDEARRGELEAICAELSGEALRLLAVADRPGQDPKQSPDEQDLVFLGLVGMIDPPRDEAKEAVAKCKAAGIRPIMITGDHPATALAIGRELGIAGPDDIAVTGRELDGWSDADWLEKVQVPPIFARVTAEHKLRIVRSLKDRGEVVAMTGDGVNDAPALRQADIGVAMGRSGTDVTREAAAMVLTDDNFASIEHAIEEGRGIYDNIQKFVVYLLSCNAGELMFVLLATLTGSSTPLYPIQILWINLVTDGPPALALGLEPPEESIMDRPPRPPEEPVLTIGRGLRILVSGAVVALAAFLAHERGQAVGGETLARTYGFATLAMAQLGFALSCRSPTVPLLRLGLLSNPTMVGAIILSTVLQVGAINLPWVSTAMFKSTPLGLEAWLEVLGFSLVPLLVLELAKLLGLAGAATSSESGSAAPESS